MTPAAQPAWYDAWVIGVALILAALVWVAGKAIR